MEDFIKRGREKGKRGEKGKKEKKGKKRKKGKRGRKEKRRVIVLKGENYLKFVSLFMHNYHGKQTKYISLLKQWKFLSFHTENRGRFYTYIENNKISNISLNFNLKSGKDLDFPVNYKQGSFSDEDFIVTMKYTTSYSQGNKKICAGKKWREDGRRRGEKGKRGKRKEKEEGKKGKRGKKEGKRRGKGEKRKKRGN